MQQIEIKLYLDFYKHIIPEFTMLKPLLSDRPSF